MRLHQRMKTLRKLGKTFTKRYAFKRKLQTDPEILSLYNKREKAISSVPAARDAALYETDEPLSIQIGADIQSSDAAKIQLIHRGQSDWPRRVMYPEQISDLRNANRDVWVVNLNVVHGSHGKSYKVRIKHLDFPMIVTMWHGLSDKTDFRPVAKESLANIDDDSRGYFYLLGHTEWKSGRDPWDVWACGVCPNEFNATFYDREVARLYAESLKNEVAKLRQAYPQE